MSGNESTKIGDDREKEVPSIAEALFDLCTSDELSITALHETINNPGLSTNYKNRFNRSYDAYNKDKTLSVLHHACYNKNVTLEIIQLLLNNSIKCFPDAAQVLSTEFHTMQGDETSISEAYPLHIACSNEKCPDNVIRFLVDRYPPACEHLSNINGGVHYDTYQAAGLPIHYYLARNRNVDIDTVKLLVEMYPQSLMITDEDEEDDEEEACYPIHALLSNEKTNNMHEILTYMLELEPSSIQLLDGRGRAPLHVSCRNGNIRLEEVQLLINKLPEAIRIPGSDGRLPIHDLCNNIDIEMTQLGKVALYEILQFMLDFDSTLLRERDDFGCLPLHHAVDGMSTEFCKALIKAYPESVRIESNGGSLPIHEACANLDRDDLVDTIQHLLELYPESINARDERGRLPFHYAASRARHGRIDIMQLLLKHDPDAASKKTTDEDCQLPLHLVCRFCKHPEAIQVLYDAFPEAIVVLDGDRKIPSQLVKKGSSKVLKFFHDQYEYLKKLEDDGIMHSPDKNGWLPLHHALKDNVSLGTIKLIVKKCPAAVRMADDKLAFPIHIACEFISVRVVKYLIERDVNGRILDQLDTNKDSILHYACRGGNLDVVKYLLANHSSLVASAEMNRKGELPVHLLCEAGKDDVDDDDVDSDRGAEHIETIWLMLLSNPEAVFLGC